MAATALILVDIQNDYFPEGDWPVPLMEAALDNAARLLAAARSAGDVIVHIRHEMADSSAPFFRPGSRGAEIHDGVKPIAGEDVLTKARPNSFLGTGLHELLQGRGVETVIICGAMSQMCIDATARAASDLGYAVIVAEDACAAKEAAFGDIALTPAQVHAAIMAPLAQSYAQVLKTAEISER